MDLGPQTLVVWPLFHDTSSNTLHYIIMPILMPLQRLACDFTFRLFGEKLDNFRATSNRGDLDLWVNSSPRSWVPPRNRTFRTRGRRPIILGSLLNCPLTLAEKVHLELDIERARFKTSTYTYLQNLALLHCL